MTIMKWKRPSVHGMQRGAMFPSVFDQLFRDELWQSEYANYVPAVNIWETKENYHISISAPGFSKENFSLKVEEDVLHVTGEYKKEEVKEEKSFTRKEFSSGSFKRSFQLPELADAEKISAQYNNGLLEIVINKKEEGKVKFVKDIAIS